ncbi:MAG: DUF975 family protein [Bacilli bacterium]|nr:DUF975 family protein [Bacilli bacterium]
MDNAKLKATARERLNGNYPVVILGLLLFILLGGCCSFIANAIHASWLTSVLMLIVESLVIMGFVGVILKIARKKKTDLEDIFAKTDLFDKYILITLILGAISLLMWVLEFLSFKSLIMVMLNYSELNIALAVVLVLFGLLLSAAIIMVGIYLAISLSQTYFVLYDNPKMKITEVLIKSFDMMADYILEYFILVLSFAGWMILGIFTLGILYIWLIPYMLVTFALFYDKVRADYESISGNPEEAISSAKASELKPIVKKTAAKTTTKKAATAKPAAKKAASKTVAKPVAKKTTTKSATKPAAKKTTAKTATKPVAKKAPVKSTTKTATKKTTATKTTKTKTTTAKKATTKTTKK